jgi:hypothetical protein
MPVRSRCFVVGYFNQPVNEWRTIYTVPAGRTAIVRELNVLVGGDVDPLLVLLAVRRPPANFVVYISAQRSANETVRLSQPYLVLHPGDELAVHGQVARAGNWGFDAYAAGSLLDGEPS